MLMALVEDRVETVMQTCAQVSVVTLNTECFDALGVYI